MKVLKYPHPVLAYRASVIHRIDDNLRKIVAEMFELMYETEGVGLAANQVGLPWRFFVMNPTGDPEKKEEERVIINPVVLKRRGRVEGEEGCLSFPDLRLRVWRAEEIVFQAVTLDGTLIKETWKGFPARVFQHENDHLSGHCFFECAGPVGQVVAEPILKSLRQIFMTDQQRGFVPDKTEFLNEMARLEAEQS